MIEQPKNSISPMSEELNMQLRSKVLEKALLIEDCMTKILLTFLMVDKLDTRTLSNRSSSLSFKQKIDLLYDLDVLTKEENGMLLLFMEFRNQFSHNSACNSFEKAVAAIDGSKNKLLKFNDLTFDADIEFRLDNAYSTLHVACLDIVLAKYEQRRAQIEARQKLISDVVTYSAIIMDSDSELISKIMKHCVPAHGDTDQEMSLKISVINMIDEHTTTLHNNEELKDLKVSLEQNLEPVQLKNFFNR